MTGSRRERHFYVSYDSTRLNRAGAWLLEQQGEKVLIAPTRSAADDLAYRLTEGKRGILGLHRLTLGQLASTFASTPLAAERRVAITSLGFEALVARSVYLTRKSQDLEYFLPIAERPGFVRALSRLVRELRTEKISRFELESIGPAGRDLAEILQTFELELDKQYLADYALLLNTAIKKVGQVKDRLLGLPLLLLDPRPQSALEKSFLKSVIDSTEWSCATTLASNEECIKWLEGILGVSANRLDRAEWDQTHQLERIRRHLFLAEIPGKTGNDNSLELFSAPGEGRESVEIARRILQFGHQGIRFDQVAVLLRNHHLYQPHIEDAFERAQIPGYFSRGIKRPHNAGRAFLALLECAIENFAASRFAEYLSLGQVPRLDPEGKSPSREVPWVSPESEEQLIFKSFEKSGREGEDLEEPSGRQVSGNLRAPLKWEKTLIDASVIGGHDRWKRRLKGLARELDIRRKSASEKDSDRELYRRQLERLRHLAGFALPLIDRLSALPKQALWSRWLTELQQLASDALREPDSVLSVLMDLAPMGKVGPVTLREVKEVLHHRLRSVRSDPSGSRFGKVFVGSLEEGASRQFDIVFVPGLAEGIFPGKIYEDPLLQDVFREKLGLSRTRDDRAGEERHLLRIATSAARSKLITSYPRMDLRQGRARVPSLYALETLRAAEGELPDLRGLQRQETTHTERRLGWPAPSREADAIDTSEFDLARLGPLLYGRGQSMEGGAFYLVKVNPWLARSIRSRFKRWESFWSDDDGLVANRNPKVRPLLEKHRFTERSYSPTALQNFAACPYRFFLYSILRIQPRKKIAPLEQMDPLVRGSLIHEIQFEFFNLLEDKALINLTDHPKEELLKILDEVISQVSTRYREELVPAIPQIWSREIEEVRIDLRSWVREKSEDDREWTPYRWELSFGLPLEGARDTHSKQGEVVLYSDMRFRGSIDLVEINRSNDKLRVIDHKTGKAPWPRPVSVGGGEVLQPLIYALVAEELLDKSASEGQLYYCTRRGGFERHAFPASRESRSRLESVLTAVDSSIRESFLPAAPREQACSYCDYRLICGPYEELRIQRKVVTPLKDLQRIRKLP